MKHKLYILALVLMTSHPSIVAHQIYAGEKTEGGQQGSARAPVFEAGESVAQKEASVQSRAKNASAVLREGDFVVTRTLNNGDARVHISGAVDRRPQLQGWVTVMSEGFEGLWPSADWNVYAESGPDAYWGDSNFMANSGSWSAGDGSAAPSAGGNYLPNMRTWMIYGPFDLSDATDATLEFYFWLDMEPTYEQFFWGAAVDGTSFKGWTSTASSGGWFQGQIDFKDVPFLGAITGQPQVWIGFLFSSDGSNEYQGVFVDDILLQKFIADDTEPPTITVSSALIICDQGIEHNGQCLGR